MLTIIQAAGWPIWPLILCSVLALGLVLERWIQLQDSKVMPDHILAQTIEATQRGMAVADMIPKLEKAGAIGPVREAHVWVGRTWGRQSPEDAKAYEHDDEGPDDMPAHLRASMTKTSETVPVMSPPHSSGRPNSRLSAIAAPTNSARSVAIASEPVCW